MEKSIEFIKASILDKDKINKLAKIAFTQTYEKILSKDQLEYMLKWMYSLESLEKQISTNHTYFLCKYKGEYCGYFSVEKQAKDLFHLQKIYLLSSFKGKKIGSKMFEKIVEFVKQSAEKFPCKIELNVNRQNKSAISFYKKMGMVEVFMGDFDIGNGYFMEDYIYGLTLESKAQD